VGAQSLTATLVYTYNADGLRVAQQVSGTLKATHRCPYSPGFWKRRGIMNRERNENHVVLGEEHNVTYELLLRQGGEHMLREASAYFAGQGQLHSALRRLVQRLNEEEIPYALLGGLALAEHGYPRLTEDIDVLLTPRGLERFRQSLVGRGYRPAFPGAAKTFRDAETGVRIKVVTTGEYPGDGLPKPVAFPDPAASGVTVEVEGIRVVTLERLIELKLASGTSAPHRLRDLADVQDLIILLELPLALAERLDSSVQAAYRDLWEKASAGSGTSRAIGLAKQSK